MSSLVLFLALLAAVFRKSHACTTLAVSPDATTDRCAYTTSTSDCKDCDFRLAYVPAKTHRPRSKRPVYLVRSSYPHHVSNRSPTWLRQNVQGTPSQLANWTESKPMGFVPQVASTFALYETGSGYALINEHMVTVGESTCPAIYVSKPISDGGRALFDVGELSLIALERATTARQAIEIMGDHATTYGYYGAEWDTKDKYNEAGETLTVADKTEAWVFHILPDKTGASAIWAAQRLAPGHVTAIANYFIIREIDTNDKANFMYSSQMHEMARDERLWQPSERLDFAKTFGYARPHSSYTTLRRWRVLTLANPAMAAVLNATTETDLPPGYPFSTLATSPFSPDDLRRIQRDHFEGTPYDLTKGFAAGPYGDPDRYDTAPNDGMTEERAKSGEFARGISLFRTSYASVARSCAHLPREIGALLHFAQHQPDTSSFIPLYLASAEVPLALTRGSLFRYDDSSYFWCVALVANWAHRYYNHAIPSIRALQSALSGLTDVARADAAATKLARSGRTADAAMYLRKFSRRAARRAHDAYARFFPELVAKLHDGYLMRDPDANTVNMTSFFYPERWLDRVGYFAGRETAAEKGREAMRKARGLLGEAPLAMKMRPIEDMRGKDGRFEIGSFFINFGAGVFMGVALCVALLYTLTDFFKLRNGYRHIGS